MTQWDIVVTLTVIVPFIVIFASIAWRFGSMISELKTMIENLTDTIKRLETEQKEDKQQILNRIEEHDTRLRQVEKELVRIGECKNG